MDKKLFTLCTTLVIIFALAGPDLLRVGAATSIDLFSDIQQAEAYQLAYDATMLRHRFVDINYSLLTGQQSQINLNLFADASYLARLERVEALPGGGIAWFGQLEENQFGSVVFIVEGAQMAGNINMPGKTFQVRFSASGVHAVIEIDQSKFPAEAEPLMVPDLALQSELDVLQWKLPSSQPATPQDTAAFIDVMVAYTSAARSAAGGTTAMNNLINLAVAETNQSYQNSSITQRLNLVHTEEVAYPETGNSNTDLSRLQGTTDGYMENLHTLRNTYQADLVALITETGDSCGKSYLMSTVSHSFEIHAFAWIRRDCATGYYSFGHELGHNMGAYHDWYVTGNFNAPYSYNKGFVNRAAHWRTIMAYNNECADAGTGNCTRIQYWSNPNILYAGSPTGVQPGTNTSCTFMNLNNPDCDADNHLVLNNTAPTVANFRNKSASLVPGAFNKGSPTNGATYLPTNPTLTWGASTNAIAYEYCYDTTNDNACSSWTSNGASTHKTLSGLKPNTTYYWHLRATNSDGMTYSNGSSNSWWSFKVMSRVQSSSVFLPLVIRTTPTAPSGIYGKVTQDGNDAGGIPLELRFYNGSAYSTLMSTSTAIDGSYQFTSVPDLTPGQGYYVRYLNSSEIPGRLSLWATRSLDSYASGEEINIGNFDIADISLEAPVDGSGLTLPQTFQWSRRTATPSDKYEFNIYDPVDGIPFWWTDPAIGYKSSYTLNSLPPGFSSGTEYAWNLWIYNSDGGYGISNTSNSVTFTGSGIVSGKLTYNGSPAAGVGLEMRKWSGSAWSTQASTTTASNGTYQFTNLPSLSSGQVYYVRYQNDENTAGRLWYWHSADIAPYVSGSDFRVEDIDIADIQLVSPADGATVSLPTEFQWVARPGAPTDSYEFNLFDPNNGYTWWYTDPLLGYTGSYTLNSLPPGFTVGINYGWEIYIYSQSGGYGMSNYYRTVRFSNSGSTPTDPFPTLPSKGNTDIPSR